MFCRYFAFFSRHCLNRVLPLASTLYKCINGCLHCTCFPFECAGSFFVRRTKRNQLLQANRPSCDRCNRKHEWICLSKVSGLQKFSVPFVDGYWHPKASIKGLGAASVYQEWIGELRKCRA